MSTKQIVEFYEESDIIRFRSIGVLEVSPEVILRAETIIDHYYTNTSGREVRCPPIEMGRRRTFGVRNRNFRTLWDRDADTLGVPRGTVIH